MAEKMIEKFPLRCSYVTHGCDARYNIIAKIFQANVRIDHFFGSNFFLNTQILSKARLSYGS